ncbi:MAG: hypothetical protein J5525_07460 [Lachnospiraceae bacterium]|nr:hypothetical protein [Lachnospiraceae bacterium]
MIHVFIVNPMAGKMDFAEKLRRKISEFKDIDYYIFDTRNAGYEGELINRIQHIFEDEKLRIYCCGGSGTLRNIVNDIDNLDNVEVAFLPCGLSNSFIKVFPAKDQKRFKQLEELIYGDVVDLDYIRFNNKNIALNSFSMGIDSVLLEQVEKYRFINTIGNISPYMWCLPFALFKSHTTKCEVTIGEKHYVDDFTEIYFGNGNILGGNVSIYDEANVTDGLGKVVLLRSDARRFWSIPIVFNLMRKKFYKLKYIAEYADAQNIYIRRINDGPIKYNVDGEMLTFGGTVKVEMVKKGLHFVVPKGVTPSEQ